MAKQKNPLDAVGSLNTRAKMRAAALQYYTPPGSSSAPGAPPTAPGAPPAAPPAPDPAAQAQAQQAAAADAYYRALVSQLGAEGAASRADTKGAIQQALIGFGLVPEGFKDKLGAIDNTTRALIQKNTDTGISGYARMLEGKQDAQRALLSRLSASGLRRSGAKGYKLRRGQTDWDRQFQDAIAALQNNVGGMYSNYAQGEAGRQQQLLQALFNSQMYSGAGTSTGGSNTQVGTGTTPGFSGQTRNVGSSYDNPDGTQYNMGNGWWAY